MAEHEAETKAEVKGEAKAEVDVKAGTAVKAQSKGKVHVYTGPGKGKTTAAFGVALRAAGHGLKVCIVQFMKGEGPESGEVTAVRGVPGVHVIRVGPSFVLKPGRASAEVKAGVEAAWAETEKVARSGDCDLLVLDEVNVAVELGLLDEARVLRLLETRAVQQEIVLTGRGATAGLMGAADYVTEFREIKHPHSRGERARRGIEY